MKDECRSRWEQEGLNSWRGGVQEAPAVHNVLWNSDVVERGVGAALVKVHASCFSSSAAKIEVDLDGVKVANCLAMKLAGVPRQIFAGVPRQICSVPPTERHTHH